MSYPPSGGSGGPYIRNYSQRGITAALGYATFSCNDIDLPYAGGSGEAGNMYFNTYSSNSSGSIVDAGITIGASTTVSDPEGIAQPFVNVSGAYVQGSATGGQWSNPSNPSKTWTCGQPIGLLLGTLPSSLWPNGQATMMFGAGLPDYDPTQFQLPPSEMNWSNSTWVFFTSPNPNVNASFQQLFSGPGTWNGIATPCSGCSVARMFTISQQPLRNDGACFGACENTPTARWDQVVMGEVTAPCSQVIGQSATCTVTFNSNGSWYGGENDSDDGVLFSEFNDQSGLEGINLNDSGRQQTSASQGRFSSSLPIAPSTPCWYGPQGFYHSGTGPDSKGYCYMGPLGVLASVQKYCQPGSACYMYDIFQKQNGVPHLIFQTTLSQGNYWSPAEPAHLYNDPNLP